MKLIYKPFAIVLGLVAGRIAGKLFSSIWARFDDAQPPEAKHQEAPLGKILGAAALQGATFAVTRAAVERSGHRSFHHVTGVWPGEKAPDE